MPLFASIFHEVSPCFAYRHSLQGETDQEYVERLAQELEDKFQQLGPDTVSAFFMEPGEFSRIVALTRSRRSSNRLCTVCSRVHDRDERSMPQTRSLVRSR